MKKTPPKLSRLQRWFQASRLLPLCIILGAAVSIVLSQIGVIQLKLSENIIISLLGLLAVDALNERLSVIERIESSIYRLTEGNLLRKRADILKPEEMAENASEICILAVHSVYALASQEFFQRKLRSGCHVRILLVNPDSKILETRNEIVGEQRMKGYIELSLKTLEMMSGVPDIQGKLEVRLHDVILPFSLFVADALSDSGTMNVNYHSSPYKIATDDPPHIRLHALTDKYWFNYYREHFELAWEKAVPWKPDEP